jgi:uncharacterized membrane protein YphA (DoxX/SURF4 family)
MWHLLVNQLTVIAPLPAMSSYGWPGGTLVEKDAKLQPTFLNGSGFVDCIIESGTRFAHTALSHSVASFLTGTVVPHASFFAWIIALSELVIGLSSLLLGIFARLWGLMAILRAITNVLVAGSGADRLGHNYMFALAGLVVLISAAGRGYVIDKLLARSYYHVNNGLRIEVICCRRIGP